MSKKNPKKLHRRVQSPSRLSGIHGVKTISEIAQDFGVHPVQVGQWKKEITAGTSELFAKKRGRKSNDEQVDKDRLYSEIGRLKMDLDWLKKSPGSACEPS